MNQDHLHSPADRAALEERFLSSETMFAGRLIDVERWQVELPNGKTAPREVVRHIGAVAVVAVDADRRVTLVEQYRAPVGRIMLELPAGKLDRADEPRLEAAQRELREETGLLAEHWQELNAMVSTPGFCDEVITLFLATGLTQAQADPDEDEFVHVVSIPLDEALRRAVIGEITDAKTICGLFLAREALNESIAPIANR